MSEAWPELRREDWRDTWATLHMWTQVAGKICLRLTPHVNHFWNIAFHLTHCGLRTPLLVFGDRAFSMTFDFLRHELRIEASDGAVRAVPLAPRSVADFYRAVMDTLGDMNIDVRIWTMPVEVPNPVRFEDDVVHDAYDGAAARSFWRALMAMRPVLERFRGEFTGKCSPVHFFWGSFDLAVTRFSGRRAPERPNADPVTREAYSHEVISHGFWPGGGAVEEPAFYAYAAPEPAGFRDAPVEPEAAFYSDALSEFILPYDAVRGASSPEAALESFLASTYAAGAERGGWAAADFRGR